VFPVLSPLVISLLCSDLFYASAYHVAVLTASGVKLEGGASQFCFCSAPVPA
jgi:hypothetical protein